MSSASSGPTPQLERMSAALRLLTLQQGGEERELRTALVAAPVITLLLQRFITHDVQSPDWPNRDRLIFSAASLAPLLCPLLHLLGQPGAEVPAPAEAPQCDPRPHGLDLPLAQAGHGLAAAVGMALATRLLGEEFGADIIDHATWVLADDDDFEPGVAQEAIALAPALAPHRLVVVHFTRRRDAAAAAPAHLARLAAAGWRVRRVEAADPAALQEALEEALGGDEAAARQPAYVAVEFEAEAPLPQEAQLRELLGMDGEDRQPAGEVCDAWRLLGLRGRKARKDWQQRLEKLAAAERAAFEHRMAGDLVAAFRDAMREKRMQLAEGGETQDMAALFATLWEETRRLLPGIVGVCSGQVAKGKDDAQGCVIDGGRRVAALVALLAGMAAHGGIVPCGRIGGDELALALPLLNEAAAAHLPFTLVVEDDGQCEVQRLLEALAPQVNVLRPGDAVELVECWQIAMQAPQGCSLLVVPRMRLPLLRTLAERANLSRLGAYELLATGEEGQPAITLLAGGWPLAAAALAARRLTADGLAVRVISLPAPLQLAQAEQEHRARLQALGGVRIGVCGAGGAMAQLLGSRRLRLLSPCAQGAVRGDVERLAADIVAEARTLLGPPAGGGEEEEAGS